MNLTSGFCAFWVCERERLIVRRIQLRFKPSSVYGTSYTSGEMFEASIRLKQCVRHEYTSGQCPKFSIKVQNWAFRTEKMKRYLRNAEAQVYVVDTRDTTMFL